MVRADIFIGRVLHMLSTGILLGACAAPYLYAEVPKLASKGIFPALAVVSALSGFYNAGMLKIKDRVGPAKAKPWRLAVYGLKGTLFLGLSPLLDAVIPHDLVPGCRLGLAVVLSVVGTWCRFYREDNTKKLE